MWKGGCEPVGISQPLGMKPICAQLLATGSYRWILPWPKTYMWPKRETAEVPMSYGALARNAQLFPVGS